MTILISTLVLIGSFPTLLSKRVQIISVLFPMQVPVTLSNSYKTYEATLSFFHCDKTRIVVKLH